MNKNSHVVCSAPYKLCLINALFHKTTGGSKLENAFYREMALRKCWICILISATYNLHGVLQLVQLD